jgi:hypothetical protein
MSMSTGDVRRPTANKLTKAVAADGDKPSSDETSTPTDKARPSTKAAPAKARTASKATAAKKAPAGRPGGAKGRKPVTPVKVSQGTNWGPIAMFGGAGLIAVLIIGFAVWQIVAKATAPTWQERASKIEGIHNYLQTNPDYFKYGPEGNHKSGNLTYPTSPPVGGTHNPRWQNCMGDVYTAQIAKEHAVHSLEHGAVWVTYNPSLPADQVAKLKSKVEGKSFMLMSPYPDLDKPISLQAWGYQLKVDNANDPRIDQFIDALRQNATQEPQAGCSGGITDASPTPIDLPQTGQ